MIQSICAWVLSHFSRVQLCATLWTVAHQAPLSMEISRQEYQLLLLSSSDVSDSVELYGL